MQNRCQKITTQSTFSSRVVLDLAHFGGELGSLRLGLKTEDLSDPEEANI
jgi:hypothetical protein